MGLSAAYPFRSRDFSDLFGWKYKPGWAPSYAAYGRMRSLLAIEEALSLKPKRVLEVAAGGGGLSATLAANDQHPPIGQDRGGMPGAGLDQ